MEWFPALPIFHSTDLAHWELISHCITDEHQIDLMNLPSAKGIWAPCLSYCETEDRFYMIYNVMHSTNARYFDVDNFVMMAQDPRGPWTKPVYLHSAGFDGSMFHDDDGRKYILSMEWETRDGWHKPGEICLAEYDLVSQSIIGYPKRIFCGATRRGCIEGPHIYKHLGVYYLVCAEGGTGYGHAVTVARSENIFGPYVPDPSGVIITSSVDFDEMDNDDYLKPQYYNPSVALQKAGHGSLTDTPEGERYMVHHCGRPLLPQLRCTLGRETCIQKMHWTDDGWLRMYTENSFAQLEVPKPVSDIQIVPPASTVLNPLEWVALRISPDTFATRMDQGWMLRGGESLSSLHRVSLLARPLTSLHASFNATLTFEPEIYQHYAGICLYYDNFDYIMLRKTWYEEKHQAVLDMVQVSNGVRIELPGTRVSCLEGVVDLCLLVENNMVTFRYRIGNGCWETIGDAMDLTVLSDEFCKAGEFTGTSVGFFNVDAMLHRNTAIFTQISYHDH
jgi:xylan 1,4-beta-xylosidase